MSAYDDQGIPALERVAKMLEARAWFLDHLDLHEFPFNRTRVAGIPMTNFQGFVANIDAHLLMYSLSKSGSYNQRQMTTLVNEQFDDEIKHMDNSGRVSPPNRIRILCRMFVVSWL